MPLSIPYNQLPDLGTLESTDLVPMLRPFQDEGKASMSDFGTFVQPYTKVIGNITQSSGSDPVLTIFENNTGANFTTLYVTSAHYELNADAAIFVENQIWVIFNNNLVTQYSGYNYQAVYNSSTKLDLYSYINGVASDNAMQNTSFEIRIYPTAP